MTFSVEAVRDHQYDMVSRGWSRGDVPPAHRSKKFQPAPTARQLPRVVGLQ